MRLRRGFLVLNGLEFTKPFLAADKFWHKANRLIYQLVVRRIEKSHLSTWKTQQGGGPRVEFQLGDGGNSKIWGRWWCRNPSCVELAPGTDPCSGSRRTNVGVLCRKCLDLPPADLLALILQYQTPQCYQPFISYIAFNIRPLVSRPATDRKRGLRASDKCAIVTLHTVFNFRDSVVNIEQVYAIVSPSELRL